MAFDGLVLKSLVNEFNIKLKDLRIDKIYQPEKDEIILSLRGYKENYKLFISADSNYPRINITDNNYVNPDKPPLFCMLLRKHLSSGKILFFEQGGSDRILKIGISSYNELGDSVVKYIIVEIMGRHSNIILTDSDNVVIDCVKHIDFTVSSKRQLLPGLIYETPPGQDKQHFNNYNEDLIRDILYSDKDINADKFMVDNFIGISPIVSREISYKALESSGNILLKDDLIKKASLYKEIKHWLTSFDNDKYFPNILYDNNMTPKFFSVIPIEQYEGLYKKIDFDSPSKMVDSFYNELHFSRKIKLRSQLLTKHITNHIEKIKKKIEIHNDIILNREKYEEYKLKGELLSANIYLLKGGESKVKVYNYYNNSDMVIDLDNTLSPAKNIDKYYRLYKKGMKALEISKEQIMSAKNELLYLENELSFLEKCESQKDIDDIKDELSKEGYIENNSKNNRRKKQEKIDVLSFETSDGYEILVGKNSKQNEYITFKLSKGNDLWFHVKDYPGSHVLLKSKGDEFSNEAILKAAEYAGYYSKDSNDKITVDYTKIKFVKKIPGGKPGMVNYTNYKTIIVKRMEKI